MSHKRHFLAQTPSLTPKSAYPATSSKNFRLRRSKVPLRGTAGCPPAPALGGLRGQPQYSKRASSALPAHPKISKACGAPEEEEKKVFTAKTTRRLRGRQSSYRRPIPPYCRPPPQLRGCGALTVLPALRPYGTLTEGISSSSSSASWLLVAELLPRAEVGSTQARIAAMESDLGLTRVVRRGGICAWKRSVSACPLSEGASGTKKGARSLIC